MSVEMHQSWKEQLQEEFQKDYFQELTEFVKEEYKNNTVYPAPENIFRAFDECPFKEVKVVILGQDPYHGPNQANGLCFSVKRSVKNPPSLRNIYKELEDELDVELDRTGDLSGWAKQGVLLLNATLTVRKKSPGSHQDKGWERFTDAAIKKLSKERDNLVFMLWGNYAQEKGGVIDQSNHLILESSHPSPYSANYSFFGCDHFIKANEYLKDMNKEPIDWTQGL
ncbi:MAG: uracil-DNA glycosylase [Candidatus Paceibacteria bacterium]